MAQQVKKAPELQDPEIRAELDRLAREEGETVDKSGTGGKTLDAQERLAEGRKKGGRSRATESGNERVEEEGGLLIEPDEKLVSRRSGRALGASEPANVEDLDRTASPPLYTFY